MIYDDQDKQEELNQQDNQTTELKACQDQVSEWRDKYLHLNADFQNYMRRQEKERGMWMHGAQASVFKELLTIVGDFDRALAQGKTTENNQEADQVRLGVEMIRASLYKLLAKFEVTEIAQNTVFDPEIHEAIAAVESPDHESGSIVTVIEKGFMFKGQVLRPAKVTVAQ